MEATRKFEDLIKIVKILRKECPWDRKQTHESIKDNLIEEAYEAVDAIDGQDFEELKKELGDLMLHVVFHSRMATESEHFTIEDVIYSIQEKLIRRHPHVFGDTGVRNEEEVAQNWEAIKKEEGKQSILDGIPKNLPALIEAQRMQEKAANMGFDWPEWQQVWEKLEEEIQEFQETLKEGEPQRTEEEFGDLLFSLVNAGRFFKLNAEDALRQTNRKFKSRFQYVESQVEKSGRPLSEVSLEEMDQFWEEAKTESKA
jgi:XTP/dITP diphosphohydrolase